MCFARRSCHRSKRDLVTFSTAPNGRCTCGSRQLETPYSWNWTHAHAPQVPLENHSPLCRQEGGPPPHSTCYVNRIGISPLPLPHVGQRHHFSRRRRDHGRRHRSEE